MRIHPNTKITVLETLVPTIIAIFTTLSWLKTYETNPSHGKRLAKHNNETMRQTWCKKKNKRSCDDDLKRELLE